MNKSYRYFFFLLICFWTSSCLSYDYTLYKRDYLKAQWIAVRKCTIKKTTCFVYNEDKDTLLVCFKFNKKQKFFGCITDIKHNKDSVYSYNVNDFFYYSKGHIKFKNIIGWSQNKETSFFRNY